MKLRLAKFSVGKELRSDLRNKLCDEIKISFCDVGGGGGGQKITFI